MKSRFIIFILVSLCFQIFALYYNLIFFSIYRIVSGMIMIKGVIGLAIDIVLFDTFLPFLLSLARLLYQNRPNWRYLYNYLDFYLELNIYSNLRELWIVEEIQLIIQYNRKNRTLIFLININFRYTISLKIPILFNLKDSILLNHLNILYSRLNLNKTEFHHIPK